MKRLLTTILLLSITIPVKAQWIIPEREMIDKQQKAYCGFEEKYKSQGWDDVTMYLNFLTNFQYTINDRKHQDYIKEEITNIKKYRYSEDKTTLLLVESRIDLLQMECIINQQLQ